MTDESTDRFAIGETFYVRWVSNTPGFQLSVEPGTVLLAVKERRVSSQNQCLRLCCCRVKVELPDGWYRAVPEHFHVLTPLEILATTAE